MRSFLRMSGEPRVDEAARTHYQLFSTLESANHGLMNQEDRNGSPVSQLAEQTSPLPVELTEAELFATDPLLSAIGLYKDLWADEHADEYIAILRKDW